MSKKRINRFFENVIDFVISISHSHEDHIGGLGSFLLYLQFVLKVTEDKIFIVCPSAKEVKDYISIVVGEDSYKSIKYTRKLVNNDVEITSKKRKAHSFRCGMDSLNNI